MNIGDNIKIYRKNKNITQQQLADAIGKSVNTIKKYESGYTNPPLPVMLKISEILCIPISKFTDNVEPDDFKEIKDMLLKEKSKFRINNTNNNFILQRIEELQNKISDTGMYTGSDIETLLNEISFILKRKDARTSLNMLKDYISSKDYDINKLNDDLLKDIDKKFTDILELEFFKLNK